MRSVLAGYEGSAGEGLCLCLCLSIRFITNRANNVNKCNPNLPFHAAAYVLHYLLTQHQGQRARAVAPAAETAAVANFKLAGTDLFPPGTANSSKGKAAYRRGPTPSGSANWTTGTTGMEPITLFVLTMASRADAKQPAGSS